MKILSVNVSMPKTVEYNGQQVTTGIFKEPIEGRVMLREFNLDGDGQADLVAHGGEFKAAYAYPYENYPIWAEELNRDDFTYGQFGENFTVEGMTEKSVHIGDIFRIGEAIVEVTQPRVPCFKLAIKMNDPGIVKKFLQSNRSGFYFKVLEEGEVGAGDDIERIKIGEEQLTVEQINNLLYFDKKNVDMLKRALKIPALSPGWVGSFQELLDRT